MPIEWHGAAARTRHQENSVADFNKANPVGTDVEYWTGDRAGAGNRGKTRTPAQMLSGHTAVVWVTGHSACISLTHVRPIPATPATEETTHAH